MDNKILLWWLRPEIVMACLAFGWHTVMAAPVDDGFNREPQLTSARLVDAVLNRNPDIPAMRAAWEAAQARIEQAGALNDPMMSYAFAPQTAGASGMDFGQKLSISQHLPWPGKRELRGDAARFESEAAHEGIEQTRLKLTEAAKSAFADWYFVHAAIRVNAINKSLLQEFRNNAEIKYSAGRASKQDALRAEVEVALLEHRDIVLERHRREVLAVLNTLLQRQPDALLPPPSNLPDTGVLPAVAELRTAVLEVHPELRALAARLQASRQQVALAEREFYPDFRLAAEYNSLWMRDEQRFTVGVGINIPLPGKHRAAKDEAQAILMGLDLTRQARMSEIMGQVQQAYDRVRESEHVLSLYQNRLLPLAEENLAAARSDYEAGRGNFLDMIGAEKNLMQAQLQLEQARTDHHRRLAALERTVGGPQALQGIQSWGIKQ